MPLYRQMLDWKALIWAGYGMLMPLTGDALLPLAFFPFWITTGLHQTRWLSALPVRRNVLLALLAGPFLGLLSVAFLFDQTLGYSAHSRPHLPALDNPRETNSPFGLWRAAWSGQLPRVEAPWGEVHAPAGLHLALFHLYDPYEWGPENSPRFRLWQRERSIEALWGPGHGEQPPASTPLTRRPRIVAIKFALVVGFGGALAWLLFVSMHARRGPRMARASQWFSAVVIVVMILAIAVLPLLAGTSDRGSAVLDLAALHLSPLLPADSALLALALAAWLAAMLWAVSDSFARAEFVVQSAQKCWAERLRS
jgi:amino acid transporter